MGGRFEGREGRIIDSDRGGGDGVGPESVVSVGGHHGRLTDHDSEEEGGQEASL